MRLIDADALIRRFHDSPTFEMSEFLRTLAIDFAKDAPTIDAVEVVRGEWLLDSDPGEPWRYRCSECGEITKDTCMGKPRANFCPWCGADMREEGR